MARNGLRRCAGSLVLAVVLLSGARSDGQDTLSAVDRRIVELVAEHRDAIVRVTGAREGDDAQKSAQAVIGTGFFISRQGHALTNASIVGNADRIWVEHRGVEYAAELVGHDLASNIALLRLRNLPADFSFLHLGDSAELPRIGQTVLRLSMPLRFDASPRLGIVAGAESSFGGRLFPCKYIRVAMDAGPGEGGSAYLDLSGRLIGVQVGALPEVDSSYVLPARAAQRIRDDLLFSGEVTFGWMGFEVQDASSIASGRRLGLANVDSGSPAREAGLLEGDILLRIGGYEVRDIDDLRNAMFYTRVGQFVEVEVRRDGEIESFSVRLAKRPDDEPLQYLRPLGRNTGPIAPTSEDAGAEREASPLLPRPSLLPEGSTRRDVPVNGG